MDWKQLGIEIAKRGAPLLGTALGGPAGGAIGAVIATALQAEDSTPDAVHAAILADPNAAAHLAELQITHQVELARIAVARLEAEHRDRADARSRDVAIRQSGSENRRADQLVWIAFIGVVGVVLAALYAEPSDAVFGFLATVGGMFLKHLGTSYDFEFGSSRGSKAKDEALIARDESLIARAERP